MGGNSTAAQQAQAALSAAPATQSATQGSGPSAGMGLQTPMFNPNAMYAPQNQVPVTNTTNAPQTALPGSINSQNPNLISPTTVGAVGAYSPLTTQQQQPQQKMGSNNATMK